MEEEEARAQELKRRRLATAEMLESPEAQTKQESNDKGGEGFLGQLTTKIVDNLQFTMKNIHIRYEDKISDSGHMFAAGITLKELSALSTDGEWKPMFISESSNTINKVRTFYPLIRVIYSHVPLSLLHWNHCQFTGIPMRSLLLVCITKKLLKFIPIL